MGKKRRVVTAARRSAGGGGGAWKKNKIIAGVLVLAILGVWIWIFSWLLGSPPPTYKNFPWTFICEDEGAEVLESNFQFFQILLERSID